MSCTRTFKKKSKGGILSIYACVYDLRDARNTYSWKKCLRYKTKSKNIINL